MRKKLPFIGLIVAVLVASAVPGDAPVEVREKPARCVATADAGSNTLEDFYGDAGNTLVGSLAGILRAGVTWLESVDWRGVDGAIDLGRSTGWTGTWFKRGNRQIVAAVGQPF